jgi:hypothetical protein
VKKGGTVCGWKGEGRLDMNAHIEIGNSFKIDLLAARVMLHSLPSILSTVVHISMFQLTPKAKLPEPQKHVQQRPAKVIQSRQSVTHIDS